MLAELAAINAAYAVIKEVIGNGKELHEAGSHIGNFFSNKKKLEKKVEQAPPGSRNLLEEFFALEDAKQKERELRNFMNIAGRPGLLDDWDRFQKKAIAEEAAAIAYAERQRRLRILIEEQKKEEMILAGCVAILLLVLAGIIFGFVYIAIR
jgi:uncharacterized protein YneF (UPF0154 family)